MITVNGKEWKAAETTTLAQLISQERYVVSRIAVEKNGCIVPKNEYDTNDVKDGDVIEIVSFVGGG